MVDETATRVQSLLEARSETLGTAESLTGGLLGALLTDVPGSSAYYRGGVISYATDLKVALLGVPEETVERYGVVSAECATRMAAGVRAATGATWGVSTTGVAGPDPQEGQPVGLVFVAVDGPSASVRSYRIEGDRDAVRRGACARALVQLLETVGGGVGALR